jgi:hypothetical protein
MSSVSPPESEAPTAGKAKQNPATALESKRYSFLVEGTMPVLDFDITGGKSNESAQQHHLSLELFNPLSGEAFEARFQKGRLEVDLDGSITYFSQSADSVSVSLFLGHSIIVTMDRKSGEVSVRTPSRIVKVERQTQKRNKKSSSASGTVTSDWVKLKLA